jgi:hypothetical protein
MLDTLRALLGLGLDMGGFGLLWFIVLALFVLSGIDGIWERHHRGGNRG